MLDELKTSAKVVGVKQLSKAIRRGEIDSVYVARNADPVRTAPIVRLAGENGLPLFWVDTMRELGAACEIAVGASAAGTLRVPHRLKLVSPE